jgi:hypothetical protein
MNNIEETSSPKKRKEVKKETKLGQDDDMDDNVISFDDLPDLGHDNNNPLKKLANWARQLF